MDLTLIIIVGITVTITLAAMLQARHDRLETKRILAAADTQATMRKVMQREPITSNRLLERGFKEYPAKDSTYYLNDRNVALRKISGSKWHVVLEEMTDMSPDPTILEEKMISYLDYFQTMVDLEEFCSKHGKPLIKQTDDNT